MTTTKVTEQATAPTPLALLMQRLGTTGRWRVTTESSTYLIDLDERTVTRNPDPSGPHGAHRHASMRRDGQPVALHSVVVAEVGSPLVLLLGPGPGVLTLRRSTPVRVIARADPVPRGRRRRPPALTGGAERPPAGSRER